MNFSCDEDDDNNIEIDQPELFNQEERIGNMHAV
mgnify:CR=1 FL=1